MLCLVNKLSNNDHQIKRVQSLISSSLSSLLPLLFLNLLPFLFYTDKLNPWTYHITDVRFMPPTEKRAKMISSEGAKLEFTIIDIE